MLANRSQIPRTWCCSKRSNLANIVSICRVYAEKGMVGTVGTVGALYLHFGLISRLEPKDSHEEPKITEHPSRLLHDGLKA